MTRGSLLICIAAAAGVVAPSVRAQSASDKAAAEALFDAAQRLMHESKFSEACAKFEQSQRIDPAIGTLLYLGDCYERSGRLASAWATFREGASMARAAGQSDRADAGEKRASLLEPRLGKLVVEIDPATRAISGLVVERGSVTLNPAVYGVSVPMDAGTHTIVASAAGYESFTTQVVVKDGEKASVKIPALSAEASATAAPDPAPEPVPAAAPPTPSPPPSVPPPRDTGTGDGQRTLGLVLGGVGVAGVVVGGVFGLSAINKNDDAKAFCPRGNVCDDPKGVSLTEDAKDAALVSNIAFGVGGAALVAGAVLYFTAPSDTTALRVTPVASRDSGLLLFGGRFQ
ncbi:MAG: hypothetical protein R3B13_24620 [Polyangiaceae bacterium]